jgi:uncharacterized protein (TIGR03435 family)
MVQSLLEGRFQLVIKREQQIRDIYVLTVARDDGRLGPDLRKAAANCQSERPTDVAVLVARMPKPSNLMQPSMGGGCEPLASMARALERGLRTTVIDETGLTGSWDYALAYQPLALGASLAGTSDVRPSLFVALEEQLGLKLERRRGPVDVVVIDSVQRPTEN